MLNGLFSPWPSYTDEEIQAVSNVLASNKVNYWTGQECREFEKEFAKYTGSKYAVAVSNGTVALDTALSSLGIGEGDEVVVTPRTFIASVSSIIKVGARPVFADVDRDSQNITAELIEAILTPNVKAIVVVHLAGMPAEMDPIMTLANKRNLFVIEDCAQAHGARYKDCSVGSIGHVSAWSFCQDKIVTTGGEGGMVTTNDVNLWKKVWSYKDHGKSWKTVHKKNHLPGFRWLHEDLGTNCRLTEMQAAIGRIQLKRLNEWSRKRQLNSSILDEVCSNYKAFRVPKLPSYNIHARYKYYVFLRPDQIKDGWNRQRIIDSIRKFGVPCDHGSCPEVYLEKVFEALGLRPKKRLPVAKELGETSLMFLVHPTLTEEEIQRTCYAIEHVMEKASC